MSCHGFCDNRELERIKIMKSLTSILGGKFLGTWGYICVCGIADDLSVALSLLNLQIVIRQWTSLLLYLTVCQTADIRNAKDRAEIFRSS